MAKLSPESPAHTRMSGIVLAAIDDLAEHEHRRRSAVFQRRMLTMAFLAWIVVVGFRIAAEQFDLGHYESIMHYVAVTLLVTGSADAVSAGCPRAGGDRRESAERPCAGWSPRPDRPDASGRWR